MMKTNWIKLMILGGFLFTSLFAEAQGRGDMMMMNPRIRKMIEQERIPYFTKELKLTPEEAKLFWPLYEEYQQKLHDIMKQDKALGKSIMDETVASQDNEKVYQEIIDIIKKKSLLKEEYLGKFKKVLPLEKVNKLMYIEHGFRMYLIQKKMGKKMGHKMSHMNDE